MTFSLLKTTAVAYQRIAADAIRLHQLAMPAVDIATALGVTDKTVAKAIRWRMSQPRLDSGS